MKRLAFAVTLIALSIISFFDAALAIGILVTGCLSFAALLIFLKLGFRKEMYWLFFIVLFIHVAAVLFIHYSYFYPFGGGEGDQRLYHEMGVKISEKFRHGDFSIKGFEKDYPYGDLYIPHLYPVFVGILYALTLPSVLIGQLVNVWFAALSSILLYLVVLEIGGSRRNAVIAGFIAGVWPTYLYTSSLLLREAMVLAVVFFSLLLLVKIIKNFSWKVFLSFLLAIGFLINFRFYIGYVVILTCILCWPLVRLETKRKVLYGIVVFVLLGLVPYVSNQGYYGIDAFKKFFTRESIAIVREEAYPQVFSAEPEKRSTFSLEKAVEENFSHPFIFIKNALASFASLSFGPFPWEITKPIHSFIFLDTIPWYFLLFFIGKGVVSFKKNNYKTVFPLILFSIITIAVLSIFFNNFGTNIRLRLPAYMTLVALADFGSLANVFFVHFRKYFLGKDSPK